MIEIGNYAVSDCVIRFSTIQINSISRAIAINRMSLAVKDFITEICGTIDASSCIVTYICGQFYRCAGSIIQSV